MSHEPVKLQFRLRTIFVITSVIAVLLAAYSFLERAEQEFLRVLAGKTGPVQTRDD